MLLTVPTILIVSSAMVLSNFFSFGGLGGTPGVTSSTARCLSSKVVFYVIISPKDLWMVRGMCRGSSSASNTFSFFWWVFGGVWEVNGNLVCREMGSEVVLSGVLSSFGGVTGF